MSLVARPGGTRIVPEPEVGPLERHAAGLPRVPLDAGELADLDAIATGAANRTSSAPPPRARRASLLVAAAPPEVEVA